MEKASLFDGVFPDKRLDERCARIFEGLVDGQCAVLRQALPEPAALAGAYRFMNNTKVVGWALSETMEAEATTVAAFQMALSNRPLSGDLLFHSDRGVQYACSAFREQLEGMPVQQSMSRKGNCWDNAVAESFFKTMKTEMVYHHKFTTRQQDRLAVFEYIEGFYNRKRRHSALGYLSPCQVEKELYQQKIAA